MKANYREKKIGNLYGINFKAKEFSLWEKIRLFFAKPIIASDMGYEKDKGVEITFKQLGDKIYVVNERTL